MCNKKRMQQVNQLGIICFQAVVAATQTGLNSKKLHGSTY